MFKRKWLISFSGIFEFLLCLFSRCLCVRCCCFFFQFAGYSTFGIKMDREHWLWFLAQHISTPTFTVSFFFRYTMQHSNEKHQNICTHTHTHMFDSTLLISQTEIDVVMCVVYRECHSCAWNKCDLCSLLLSLFFFLLSEMNTHR